MATQDDAMATQDEGMTGPDTTMSTLEYRGNGIRAVAVIIDLVILFVIGYIIAILTGSTTPTGFSLQGGPALLWFISCFAYYIILEAGCHRTVGMVFRSRPRGLLPLALNSDNTDCFSNTGFRTVAEVCEEFYDTL
jgi:hypothetical protein